MRIHHIRSFEPKLKTLLTGELAVVNLKKHRRTEQGVENIRSHSPCHVNSRANGYTIAEMAGLSFIPFSLLFFFFLREPYAQSG